MTIRFHFLLIVVDNNPGGARVARPRDRRPKHRTKTSAARPCWGKPMATMEFHVCLRDRDSRWIVRLDNAVYGAYLDKEQALLDAVDAARDVLQSGRKAQVWLRDHCSSARIL